MPRVLEAGGGPALIFLHGWTMDGSIFDNQFSRLQHQFHCLAPDLPGHGQSAGRPATLDSAAGRVRELIETRALKDVVLVGWSMGAATAWRYFSRYGSAGISGLMTVDMSPKIVNEDGWQFGLKGQTRTMTEANSIRFKNHWPASAGAIAAGMFADRKGPAMFGFDDAVARIRKTDSGAMNEMWASLTTMDERSAIAGIDVPYLVSHGARSRVYRDAVTDWLVKQAPRARKHRFAASGHSPHLEEPDAFAAVLADFAVVANSR